MSATNSRDPRDTQAGWLRRVTVSIALLSLLTSGVAAGFSMPSSTLQASSTQQVGASLSQWANQAENWVSGNLNTQSGANRALYREGEAVPLRVELDGLEAATEYTLHIAWTRTRGGIHAYDHLVSYDFTADVDPDPCVQLNRLGGCPDGDPHTSSIPSDDLAGGYQEPGEVTVFGGEITGFTDYGLDGRLDHNSERTLGITFATGADTTGVVLTWGGHLASELDWGEGAGASSVSGSAVHMQLGSLDDKQLGAQKRGLQRGVVVLEDPQLSDLVVTKSVDGGELGAGDEFEFVLYPTDAAGDAVVAEGSSRTVTSQSDEVTWTDLEDGDYWLCETGLEHGWSVGWPSGLAAESLTVDDDTFACVVVTVDGEDVSFTVDNVSPAALPGLAVTKTVDGGELGAGDEFEFVLYPTDAGGDAVVAEGSSRAVTSQSDEVTWTDLEDGDYWLCETGLEDGWSVGWPSGLDAESLTVDDDTFACVVVTVDGEDVSFTVDNTSPGDSPPPLGEIALTKTLDGDDDLGDEEFEFALFADGEQTDESGTLSGTDNEHTFEDLDLATYELCESGFGADTEWSFEVDGVDQDPAFVADQGWCVEVELDGEATVTMTWDNIAPVEPIAIVAGVTLASDADGDGEFSDEEFAENEGDDVDFQVAVFNDNPVDVVIVELTDSYEGVVVDLLEDEVLAGEATLTDNTCAELGGETVPAGESETCAFTLEGYAPAAGEDVVSTVAVELEEPETGARATADDTAMVTTVEEGVADEALEQGAVDDEAEESVIAGELPKTGSHTLRMVLVAILSMLLGASLLVSPRVWPWGSEPHSA